MEIKELLDIVSGGEWYLDQDGSLCSVENDDCPLWYAYRHLDPDENGDAEDYVEAGTRIGLSETDAIHVAQAADGRGQPRLRKRLLRAVGLS